MDILDEFPCGFHVMLVESGIEDSMLTELMLRQCNYQVTTFNEAISASTELYQAIRNPCLKYDIILWDMNLPGFTAIEMLESMKRCGSKIKIPVIVFDKSVNQDAVIKCITLGACDFYVKPFSKALFKGMWQHAIRQRIQEAVAVGVNHDAIPANYLQRGRTFAGSSSNSKRRVKGVPWTSQQHRKFMRIMEQLGPTANASTVHEMMNDPHLTLRQVANRLYSYRCKRKKQVHKETVAEDVSYSDDVTRKGKAELPGVSFGDEAGDSLGVDGKRENL